LNEPAIAKDGTPAAEGDLETETAVGTLLAAAVAVPIRATAANVLGWVDLLALAERVAGRAEEGEQPLGGRGEAGRAEAELPMSLPGCALMQGREGERRKDTRAGREGRL